MAWFTSLLIVVQVVAALAIIVLVLLQHGKGADMGAAFGSGASGSLFGASGSANFLSRSTAVMAAVFFAATLGLAYASTSMRTARVGGGGLMSSEPAAPATAAKPGSDVPGTAAGGAATPAGATPDGAADKKSAAPADGKAPASGTDVPK